jgi:predicted HTH transcriptional regulator
LPFYTKPLSQLDTADLQELLSDQAVENARLEFKLLAPDKEHTLKKLSSFANTFGGYMLIGAKADSKVGRLQDLPGIDPVPGYKQKVIDWCFAGASPPLTVEVSDPIPAPAGNAKVCYAIYVPESDVAPHFLNGRKGVWVRTDEFSANFDEQLANDVELRHLSMANCYFAKPHGMQHCYTPFSM